VKGSKEAHSKTVRDSTWKWFTDDFRSRFADKAGLLVIASRRHIDDPIGRMIDLFGEHSAENPEGIKVLLYPAIAEQATNFRKQGGLLFPELKSLDFLRERKAELTEATWQALYQQNPIVVGGGQLPIEKFRILPYWERKNIAASIRYWDKGNSEHGAYTAGVLMHRLYDNTYIVEDVARGRWSALEREQRIKATTESDAKKCYNYQIWIEQEPGSGGKESAENTIRNLARFRVQADRVTGSKVERAQPFAAQVQAGNISLVNGPYVDAFRDECEAWPSGKNLDQVDAAAGAFNKLVIATRYNSNYSEWL